MRCWSSERYKPKIFAIVWRRGRAFTALAPVALALVMMSSAEAQNLSANAQQQIRALLSEKASRTPAQAKMDSHLVHAAQILSGQPVSPDFPTPPGELEAVRPDARNFVEVDIRADVNPDLLALIRSLGGTVVNAFPEYESVRARLPLLSVERVAQRSEVRQIRVADRAYVNAAPAGSPGARLNFAARGLAVRARLAAFLAARKGAELPAPVLGNLLRSLSSAFFAGPDNSGDVAHQANSVRSNFAFDGTGVKVGLLSDGVDSLAKEQTAGNLPATVHVIGAQAGSGDEGTAMLEIVYTLAPGATLYFATGNPSQAQMASNIQALADAGCNIIVDDISYFGEGVFQDDILARKVNAVTSAGVFYFAAAGNSGSLLQGTSGTWQGDFADSGTTLSGAAVHSFGATNYDTLTKASQAQVIINGICCETGAYELKWSDPLGQSNNDYDLFITDSIGNVVGSSTNSQTGTQDPEENITGIASLATACGAGTCRIVVVKHAGAAARTLYLDTERGNLQFATNSATYGHAAASGAFGTAATDARYAIPLYRPACTSGFSPSCNNGVEAFSSDGPRQMFFNPDGTALTPNNLLIGTSGGAVLNKPDFTAADGATTGVAGYQQFFGTSAAAPHAAAIAALMLQAVPTLTPANMRAALAANAIDIEGPAPNINAGAGIVMAPAAVQSACGYSVGPLSPVAASGASVSLAIQASPNCPWTISGLPSWISGATSGKGTATVTLTVAANSGVSRAATVFLAAGTLNLGASASIAQAAPLAIATSATLLSGYTTGAYSQDLTATGGTGAYTWSKTGSLPAGLTLTGAAITGTPTAAGPFSFTLQVADSATPPATVSKAFTITVASVGGAGATLARVGVLAQFAAGGGWDTEIWLLNNSAAAIPARVVFHGDDGTPAFRDSSWTTQSLPFTVTQGSDVQSANTAMLDRVIAPNSALVINTGAVAANVQGWADVLATGTLSGFAIFRNVAIGEGTAPLQSQSPATLLLPFDNTTGANGTFSTGIAIGNISASSGTITATVWDTSGTQIASGQTVFFKAGDPAHKSSTWAGNSHDSYLLNDVTAGIPATFGIRGVVQFQTSVPGGALTGVGLRVRTVGSTTTFTSVPTIAQ